MKQICVVGVGYVGLVTAAIFADLGNRVIGLDISEEKIDGLKRGVMPIYEPGLKEIIDRNVRANRLSFTTSYQEGLEGTEFVFIAVGTPSGVDGEADLRYVAAAARSIAEIMTAPLIIINKSTVPVGTGDWVSDIVRRNQPNSIPFAVVSCPEFLREGSAIQDCLQPHRTVLGSMDRDAAEKVAQLHLALRAPIMITDLRTAEMIKYASNAFLATKISFINEIANVCEALGADVKEVAIGMGYDKRIGAAFLDAGLGYGGSCFPKDVKALAYMAAEKGRHPQLLHAVMEINNDRRPMVVNRVREMLGDLNGCVVGLLGLSFKPNTGGGLAWPVFQAKYR
jgi:UDPglucose 6-dehydrogenase